MPAERPIEERFFEKVTKTDDCWLWTGAVSAGGYGRIGLKSRTFQAHRVSYELLVGPIPEGLHIDHLCRVKACVNPGHLQAVTQAENNLRMWQTRRPSHCKRGHAFTATNTMFTSGGRNCRTCRNARSRELRQQVAS